MRIFVILKTRCKAKGMSGQSLTDSENGGVVHTLV